MDVTKIATGMVLAGMTLHGLLHEEVEQHTHEESHPDAAPQGPGMTAIDFGGTLYLRTGPAPAEMSDPDTGTELARNSEAVGSGTIGHFRIKSKAGTTILQGSVTDTTGNGEMRFDNPICVSGGVVVVPPRLVRYLMAVDHERNRG